MARANELDTYSNSAPPHHLSSYYIYMLIAFIHLRCPKLPSSLYVPNPLRL